MKKTLSLIINLTAVVIIFAYIFYDVDVDNIKYLNINFYSLALSILVLFVSFLFLSLRWFVLVNHLTFKEANNSIFICLALNNVLPARLGEIAKILYLKRNNCNISKSLPLLLIERLMDVAVVIVMLLIGFLLYQDIQFDIKIVWIFIILFLIAFSVINFFVYNVKFVIRYLSKSKYRKIATFTSNILKVLARLKFNQIIYSIFLTIIIWAFYFLFMVLTLESLVDVNMTIEQSFFVFLIVTLASMISLLPGGLGVTEAAFVFALGTLSYSSEYALLVGIYFHINQILFPTLYGFYVMKKNGFTFSMLRNK